MVPPDLWGYSKESTTTRYSRWLVPDATRATPAGAGLNLVVETYGALTDARRAMFPAAIVSAGPEKPQDTQTKRAWVRRFAGETNPHWGQVHEVWRGSTASTVTPARRALYSIFWRRS